MKQQGNRIVLYAGGMGPPMRWKSSSMPRARLHDQSRDLFHADWLGYVPRATRAARRKSTELEFQNEVDRSIVHGMLHASDCAVVSFHKNALYHHGISPNKLFDYCLFAPRSVIACEPNALAGLEDLVTSRCEPDDPSALAEGLISALQAPERDVVERSAIVGRFSYSRLAELYLDKIG